MQRQQKVGRPRARVTDRLLREILENSQTIVVYGMSADPEKPAHFVPAFLQSKGYSIIPVNPHAETILGRKSYASLDEIPSNLQIDLVQVFRPSDQALDVVKEAVARHRQHRDIHVVWLQLDIENKAAKQLAEETGITFVQNRCMMREYERLFDRGDGGLDTES